MKLLKDYDRGVNRFYMKDGKLVTVIITSHAPPRVQNFIEHIATKIRIAFFDQIFYEEHWEKSIVPEKNSLD